MLQEAGDLVVDDRAFERWLAVRRLLEGLCIAGIDDELESCGAWCWVADVELGKHNSVSLQHLA